jgi:hypothetical protein
MAFDDMTLPEVIREVLTPHMTQTEPTVRMLVAGYETIAAGPDRPPCLPLPAVRHYSVANRPRKMSRNCRL